MITTLFHGISAMIDNAEGALVQTAEITAKVQESLVTAMVGGATHIARAFTHSLQNDFSVTGVGDLTLIPSTTTSVAAAHFSSGFITGGKVTIREFKYAQKVGEVSNWSYEGSHYPMAA